MIHDIKFERKHFPAKLDKFSVGDAYFKKVCIGDKAIADANLGLDIKVFSHGTILPKEGCEIKDSPTGKLHTWNRSRANSMAEELEKNPDATFILTLEMYENNKD